MKKLIFFFILFMSILNVEAKNVTYVNLDGVGSITIDTETMIPSSASLMFFSIDNLSSYSSIFKGSEDNYPLYIIEDNGNYSFSDFKVLDKNNYILSTKMFDISFDSKITENTCDNILGVNLINFLKNNIVKIVYILIPILLLVYSTFDLAKLVMFEEKEGISGAFTRFRKRVIVSFLIFLIPNILIFLTTTFGSEEIKSCITTFQTSNTN